MIKKTYLLPFTKETNEIVAYTAHKIKFFVTVDFYDDDTLEVEFTVAEDDVAFLEFLLAPII